jgi:hypothetical protein
MMPMQPGDVPTTDAEIGAPRRDLGFEPRTPIAAGVPRSSLVPGISWAQRAQSGVTP